jgi:O-methyltransferase involved in polyketide biosynthesis
VRLEDVLDAHAHVPREREVLVDLELWVDDRGDARVLVAHQVGGAAEVVVGDLAEDHGAILPDVEVELAGVPETALWTLYHRALGAGRADAVISDPLAVELVERLDHPFAERFGDGRGFSQWQALRAATFDREVRRFAAACPGGTVVALGEGLETGFWRAGDGLDWLTVDVPEMVALRDRALPASPRRRSWAGSALDAGWMDEVDGRRGVLITAQGLLMYFSREATHRLVSACARRFPGGALVFDAVPGLDGRPPVAAGVAVPAAALGVGHGRRRGARAGRAGG